MKRKDQLKLRVWGPLPVDPELAELRRRNEERAALEKAKLGDKHVFHPENAGVNWGWRTKR